MPRRRIKFGGSNWKMVLGLTGALSSGKTTALLEFKKLGAHTVSSDSIVHQLYKRAPLKNKIRQVFGRKVLKSQGSIDRQKLGNLVFKFPQSRKKLEKLIHPLVAKEINQDLKKKKGTMAVVEVPLLFEAGWKNKFDGIIVVASSPKESMKRFLKNQNSAIEFQTRAAAQWPVARKMKMGDFVVRNNGTRSQLKSNIARLWSQLQNQITHLS